MLWVDALSNKARMIDLHPVWDGANKKSVGPSVGSLSFMTHFEASVTVVLTSLPKPTRFRFERIRKEALKNWRPFS